MTTIVAVQGPTWAVVGFDSQVTEDSNRRYTMSRGSSKVVKNGDYILGAAGDVRAINLLAHAFRPPALGDLLGIKLDRFMTSRFVPALRACFEDQGYAAPTKDSKEIAEQGSKVLAVANGVIYVIGEDYSWVRDITGVYSFGSGGDFAAGALFSLGADTPATSMMTTEKMIRKSLAVAARLDPGTGSPFHVVTQSQPLSKTLNTMATGARRTNTKDVIVKNKRRSK
jgi:ATP-dependent protease HslVU (ClpYQ) peptidase subunit